MADSPMSDSEQSWLTLSITHRKTTYELSFPEDATITDLFNEIEASLLLRRMLLLQNGKHKSKQHKMLVCKLLVLNEGRMIVAHHLRR